MEVPSEVLNILIAGAIAWITSAITTKHKLKHYASEKSWDKKLKAYGDVLTQINSLMLVSSRLRARVRLSFDDVTEEMIEEWSAMEEELYGGIVELLHQWNILSFFVNKKSEEIVSKFDKIIGETIMLTNELEETRATIRYTTASEAIKTKYDATVFLAKYVDFYDTFKKMQDEIRDSAREDLKLN